MGDYPKIEDGDTVEVEVINSAPVSDEEKRILAIYMQYAFGYYLPHREPEPRRDGTG